MRTELGTADREGPRRRRRSLLHLAHLTDVQLTDTQSPGRLEFLQRHHDEPRLAWLCPSYRPQEFLAGAALEATVRTLNTLPRSPLTGAAVQLVVSTGDNIDNITASPRGGLLLCENGDSITDEYGDGTRLLGITADGASYAFAKNAVDLALEDTVAAGKRVFADYFRASEWAGACFDPAGEVLPALEDARAKQGSLERERERLSWQIGEIDKLAPGEDEWEPLNAEHQRLSHAQALLSAARTALDAVSEAEPSADALTSRAVDALSDVAAYDARLAPVVEVLQGRVTHAPYMCCGRAEWHPPNEKDNRGLTGAGRSVCGRLRRCGGFGARRGRRSSAHPRAPRGRHDAHRYVFGGKELLRLHRQAHFGARGDQNRPGGRRIR